MGIPVARRAGAGVELHGSQKLALPSLAIAIEIELDDAEGGVGVSGGIVKRHGLLGGLASLGHDLPGRAHESLSQVGIGVRDASVSGCKSGVAFDGLAVARHCPLIGFRGLKLVEKVPPLLIEPVCLQIAGLLAVGNFSRAQ